jgi:N utilization substance protein B
MPAANRSAVREAVVQTAFECDFRAAPDSRADFLAKNLAELDEPSLDIEFGERLLAATFAHQAESIDLLTQYAPDWSYEKIARLDRAILLVGLAELCFLPDEKIPPAVTLNEFVEIAKNYGGDPSRRFINGVLSAVKKARESEAAGSK